MEGAQLLGAVAVFRDITDVLTREVDLARERERAEAQMHVAAEALGHSQSDFSSLSKHLINSHEQELQYLAKSFHNDFSQSTALLGLQLDALFTTVGDNTEALEQLRAMRSQVDSLSEGFRHTSHDLYPSALSDLGLLPALRELIEEFQSNGLDVVLRAKGTLPDQIPVEIAIAIYRIIEEAIVNPAKSASDAPSSIVFSVKDGQLQLLIEGRVPIFRNWVRSGA
jgi:signal transduction histidine kinase